MNRYSGWIAAFAAAVLALGHPGDLHAATKKKKKPAMESSGDDTTSSSSNATPAPKHSSTPPLDLPGVQCIEWGGAQRWLRGQATVKQVRAAAVRAGGHATLFRGAAPRTEVFTPLSAPLQRIHKGLKTAFDPRGIFNPGRMYPGL